MEKYEILYYLFFAVTIFLSGIWCHKKILSLIQSRRFKKGRKAEKNSRKILEDKGYRVVTAQKKSEASVILDGRNLRYHVRADFLVKKDGKEYIVEVKSGKKAPDILYTPTRRQMLEYYELFPDHDLILLDMNRKELKKVSFPKNRGGNQSGKRFAFIAGIALGIGITSAAFIFT